MWAGAVRAKGYYLVVLHADTVLTPAWLERMIACSFAEWPRVGMVGPVANDCQVSEQLVRPDYSELHGLAAFARRRLAEFQGQALAVEQLADDCVFMRRDVYEQIAGSGGFDCAEWCNKVRAAGLELLVALDVYLHRSSAQADTPIVTSAATDGVAHLAPVVETPRADGNRPRVSLCMMIVKNERGQPAGLLLASVAGIFVDEVIVVDTGSSDRTCQVAQRRGRQGV